MRALFVELPAFERLRNEYLDDESFRAMQNALMDDPSGGDIIQGTAGLRKLRWYGHKRRGKGKRGGLRVIYFYWSVDWSSGSLRCTRRMSQAIYRKGLATLEGLLKIDLKMRK